MSREDRPDTSCGQLVADEVLQDQGGGCLRAICTMGRTVLRGLAHAICRPST